MIAKAGAKNANVPPCIMGNLILKCVVVLKHLKFKTFVKFFHKITFLDLLTQNLDRVNFF